MLADGFLELRFPAPIGACASPICKKEAQQKKVPPKVKFTPDEDQKLLQLVKIHGVKDWQRVAQLMGTRNARQCRERYKNYINPHLRKGGWTPEEDRILEEKYLEFGPRWNKVAKFFMNRSDNALRNRWMMITRHRAKARLSPISPPQSAHHPKAVTQVVKDRLTVQKELNKPSFENLSIFFDQQIDSLPVADDFWNDLSFF